MTKFLIPFLLLISINAFAFAKVIADVGPTIDATPFINQMRGDKKPTQKITAKAAYENYYTEQSKELTPGKVKARTVNIKNLP